MRLVNVGSFIVIFGRLTWLTRRFDGLVEFDFRFDSNVILEQTEYKIDLRTSG
jgi:hypothetical protein